MDLQKQAALLSSIPILAVVRGHMVNLAATTITWPWYPVQKGPVPPPPPDPLWVPGLLRIREGWFCQASTLLPPLLVLQEELILQSLLSPCQWWLHHCFRSRNGTKNQTSWQPSVSLDQLPFPLSSGSTGVALPLWFVWGKFFFRGEGILCRSNLKGKLHFKIEMGSFWSVCTYI